MCGICGVMGHSDAFAVSEELAQSMSDTIAHRGPDGDGTWASRNGRVAFGHRRLSIVDLSPAGAQPMTNEDGTVWITYNGEIYNHAALREELEAKGHQYRSRTDTETLIHLYEEEGPRCVERLHGMFAFAIWDERRQELFLARDRLGIKPLYYAQPAGGFVFGSEIKALLKHPAITPELDEEAFFHYLTFVCTPAPMTMFRGIRKLAPAERMIVSADGSIHSETWWSPFSRSAAADVAAMDEDEMRERLLELLRGSIKKRMMADVPFGVFLSGGLDSSTNVALMDELMDDPVQTFSIGFTAHEQFNELEYAREIAQRYGADHHEVMIDSAEAEEFLPELIYHQDEPLADWVCVPLYYVSKLARDSGTIVVQVGEGSDELFHGYDLYRRAPGFDRAFRRPFQRLPRPLRVGAASAVSSLARRARRGEYYVQDIVEAAEGRLAFWGGAICLRGDLKERVLAANGDGPAHSSYDVVEQFWEDAERQCPGADFRQKMTYLELKQRLAELLLMRVDKMTMATSVEARVPFLDHELVEFALALPPDMKVRNGTGKYILKSAVSGILPDNIVNRRKQGFGAPVGEWFRDEFGQRVQRQIKESSLVELGLLDYDRIDDLWAAHRHPSASDWAFQLWSIYNVSAWHDYWVAGRALA
jgi:asparagine synthase (glutamine-hydrolysing)